MIDDAEIEQHKAEKARREAILRKSYFDVFKSDGGKAVLADLRLRYGFESDGVERPSARIGMRAEDVFLTEGMKEPVRHILRMIEQPNNETTSHG